MQGPGTLTDKNEINTLVAEFYGIFNNTSGKMPDFNHIHTLCIPETIIIKKQGQDQEVYSLTSFLEPRIQILTDGTLIEFDEHETEEHTTISNNIAQRLSRFQKSGKRNNQFFSQSGTKLFHFIRTYPGWRICAVLWEDD